MQGGQKGEGVEEPKGITLKSEQEKLMSAEG